MFRRLLLDSVAKVVMGNGGVRVVEEVERLGAGWAEAAAAAEQEVVAWRREHRRPTLTELEQMTAAVVHRLQRRLLEDLALDAASEERPDCPRCRTPMERRGRKVREVVVVHQAQPVRLVRPYFVCPACGAGLSPPR